VAINSPVCENVNYLPDNFTAAIDIEGWNAANTGPAPAGQIGYVSIQSPTCKNVGTGCVYVSGANYVAYSAVAAEGWYGYGASAIYVQSGCDFSSYAIGMCNDTAVDDGGAHKFQNGTNTFGQSGSSIVGAVSSAGQSSPGFSVDPSGNVTAKSYATAANPPALTSCGTSPSVDTGSSNSAGQFTLGTGSPTACTVTFAVAYPSKAFCTVSPASSGGAAISGGYYISAQSKTAFTLTIGTGTNSLVFNYTCGGN
jgi:hypothetical protein